MIILGNTYFWKFLTTCDSAFLDESAEELRSALSEVMGEEFALEQPGSSNREIIRRWSQGCFNEVGEQNLVFPRVCLVYRPLSRERDEHWIADIFFTRAPHIRGLYSNRSNNHVLTPAVEQELSARLINSYLADVFVRKSDNAFVGTAAGLYVYQKIHHIALLKNLSEASKYTPPGSDLKNLLESLSAVLPEGQPSSLVIELSKKRSAIRGFLETCDRRVLNSLGQERLSDLLKAADVSVKEWLNAGTRGLLQRFLVV